MRHPTKLRKRNLWRKALRHVQKAPWTRPDRQVPASYMTKELKLQRALDFIRGMGGRQ